MMRHVCYYMLFLWKKKKMLSCYYFPDEDVLYMFLQHWVKVRQFKGAVRFVRTPPPRCGRPPSRGDGSSSSGLLQEWLSPFTTCRGSAFHTHTMRRSWCGSGLLFGQSGRAPGAGLCRNLEHTTNLTSNISWLIIRFLSWRLQPVVKPHGHSYC